MKNDKVTTVAAPEESKDNQWINIEYRYRKEEIIKIANSYNFVILTKKQAIIVKKAIEAFFGED